jgi:hypothetical protein
MSKRYIIPTIAVLVIALTLVVGVIRMFAPETVTAQKDSGVSVCMQMAKSSSPATLDEEWRKQRLTEFGLSKDEAIRTAGTNFVEAAYTMNLRLADSNQQQLDELNSNLVTKYAVLRNACANKGVTIPALDA